MTETAVDTGVKNETIDQTIEHVETLYRSVTGRDAPPAGEQTYAGIPPERAPEQHVQEQIDRLIGALAQLPPGTTQAVAWAPPLSIWENQTETLIRLDLPGVPRNAAKVTAARGILEVSGRRVARPPEDPDQHRLRYMEPWHGEFRRVIPLPLDAEADRLQAQMRDGVLEIKVPRKSRPSEARSIPVG